MDCSFDKPAVFLSSQGRNSLARFRKVMEKLEIFYQKKLIFLKTFPRKSRCSFEEPAEKLMTKGHDFVADWRKKTGFFSKSEFSQKVSVDI